MCTALVEDSAQGGFWYVILLVVHSGGSRDISVNMLEGWARGREEMLDVLIN